MQLRYWVGAPARRRGNWEAFLGVKNQLNHVTGEVFWLQRLLGEGDTHNTELNQSEEAGVLQIYFSVSLSEQSK